MKSVFEVNGHSPKLHEESFVADSASVMGQVELKKGASVWFNATLRGDIDKIVVGEHSNIQDNCAVHVDEGIPVIIGDNVTIGHGAVVHACIIQDNVLIGMGATILDNAEIGEGSIIAAGSVVAPNSKIPPFSMVMGIPGKVVRQLDKSTAKDRIDHALNYEKLWKDMYR